MATSSPTATGDNNYRPTTTTITTIGLDLTLQDWKELADFVVAPVAAAGAKSQSNHGEAAATRMRPMAASPIVTGLPRTVVNQVPALSFVEPISQLIAWFYHMPLAGK